VDDGMTNLRKKKRGFETDYYRLILPKGLYNR
jgi:hypothetical protein